MRLRRLSELPPEAPVIAVAVLVLLTAGGGHLYVVGPSLQRYGQLEGERSQLKADLKAHGDAANPTTLAVINQEVIELRDRFQGGSAGVPLQEIESYVIDALHRVSVHHDVSLQGVRPEESEPVLAFEELPYEIDVTGDYFSLFAWFQEVEAELRPMVVKRFEISRSARSEPIRLHMRLVAYRSRDEGS